jgi:hypothetical protein
MLGGANLYEVQSEWDSRAIDYAPDVEVKINANEMEVTIRRQRPRLSKAQKRAVELLKALGLSQYGRVHFMQLGITSPVVRGLLDKGYLHMWHEDGIDWFELL